MKKRILLITFILIILLTSLITLYILNKKYNEQNAISKLKLNIIDDNIINEDVILESYTDENNIENKEQETVIQDNNNTTENINTNTSQEIKKEVNNGNITKTTENKKTEIKSKDTTDSKQQNSNKNENKIEDNVNQTIIVHGSDEKHYIGNDEGQWYTIGDWFTIDE